MKTKDPGPSFSRFVEIIGRLRTPGTGCPWDLEQDHRSLRPYLIEEAHEVLDAIERGNDASLADELGDVLLQVVLHARLAEERGAFGIEEVLLGIIQKMIRRHPHVFGDKMVESSAQVLKNWEAIKLEERALIPEQEEGKAASKTPLADRLAKVPQAMPALLRAQRLGEKAARVHFDWSAIGGVFEKVHEELRELQESIDQAAGSVPEESQSKPWPKLPEEHRRALEHELGDVLFSLCQTARWLGINAEDSLRECSSRFMARFAMMEESLDRRLEEYSEDELEAAWQEAKRKLK